MRTLIDNLYSHLPQQQQLFERKVKRKYPPSTEDLPKSKLYMKVTPGATRQQRNHFKNDLLNYINDDQVYLFDSFSFSEDIEQRMIILQILNFIISVVCYAMGLFQLILTVQANIRDSQYELGVLRSMGMNKFDVLKLTVYESVSVNLASIICGFIIGLMVSVSQIGMFLLFLELPFRIVIPFDVVVVVSFLSVGTMALGCWLGAKELYRKSISSTLKGI